MGGLEGLGTLVTGGGSGIGAAAAARLAADGAHVTICGRTRERLEAAAAAIRATAAAGAEVATVVADVTVEAEIAAAVKAAAVPAGGLDICVASAGGGTIGPIVAMPAEEWRRVLDLNLTGTFLTLKHAGAAMVRRGGGAFVAVSSIAAGTTHRFMSPYSAAKAGVDMLVAVGADELGGAGVRVNAVAPSFVDDELMAVVRDDATIVDSYLDNMPIRRLGDVDDTTEAIRWLAGPASSWVTGESIRLDGGHHLRRGPDYASIARAIYGDAVDGIVADD